MIRVWWAGMNCFAVGQPFFYVCALVFRGWIRANLRLNVVGEGNREWGDI